MKIQFKGRYSLFAGILLLLFSATAHAGPLHKLFGFPQADSNEKPMYGFSSYEDFIKNRTIRQEAADRKLIDEVTKGPGGEPEAFRHLVYRGWQYLSEGDWKTSMKRFNQTMLLRPHDFNVYWGFAANLGSQKKFDESLATFEKSKSFYQPSQLLHDWDYVTFLRDFANSHINKMDGMGDGSDKQAMAAQLIGITEEALGQPPSEKNKDIAADLNLMWAYGLYAQQKFEESWQKVHRTRALFPKLLEEPERAAFVKALSQKMPDPGE